MTYSLEIFYLMTKLLEETGRIESLEVNGTPFGFEGIIKDKHDNQRYRVAIEPINGECEE